MIRGFLPLTNHHALLWLNFLCQKQSKTKCNLGCIFWSLEFGCTLSRSCLSGQRGTNNTGCCIPTELPWLVAYQTCDKIKSVFLIAMEKDFGSLWLILSDFIPNIGYFSLLIVSVILLWQWIMAMSTNRSWILLILLVKSIQHPNSFFCTTPHSLSLSTLSGKDGDSLD